MTINGQTELRRIDWNSFECTELEAAFASEQLSENEKVISDTAMIVLTLSELGRERVCFTSTR